MKPCVIFLSLVMFAWAPPALAKGLKTKNVVVIHFADCERQVETKKQRRDLAHALTDMLDTPPEKLRLKRYRDNEGNTERWSVTTILTKYYVPKHPTLEPYQLEEEAFFKDYTTPQAKDVIKRELHSLKKSMALD